MSLSQFLVLFLLTVQKLLNKFSHTQVQKYSLAIKCYQVHYVTKKSVSILMLYKGMNSHNAYLASIYQALSICQALFKHCTFIHLHSNFKRQVLLLPTYYIQEGKRQALLLPTYYIQEGAFQMALLVKNSPASVGAVRDMASILRSGRSPGGWHGHPFQYSCWGTLSTDEPGGCNPQGAITNRHE